MFNRSLHIPVNVVWSFGLKELSDFGCRFGWYVYSSNLYVRAFVQTINMGINDLGRQTGYQSLEFRGWLRGADSLLSVMVMLLLFQNVHTK